MTYRCAQFVAFILSYMVFYLAENAESSAESPRAQASNSRTNLEDLEYEEARRLILRYGWKPTSGECGGGGAGDIVCKQYPEINNCSGVNSGYCDMSFSKKGRCLTIVTVGGPPLYRRNNDTVVERVKFHKVSCTTLRESQLVKRITVTGAKTP